MSHLSLVHKSEHLIREIYDDFILSRQAMLCTGNTLEFYSFTTGKFIERLLGKGIDSPEEITSSHVRAYLSQLRERNLSDNTLQAHARAIRIFLRFCLQEGYVSKVIPITLPKIAKKPLPLLNDVELRKIIEVAKKPRDNALVLLLVDAGLRRAAVVSP